MWGACQGLDGFIDSMLQQFRNQILRITLWPTGIVLWGWGRETAGNRAR